MKKSLILTILLICCTQIFGINIRYTKSDSVAICEKLSQLNKKNIKQTSALLLEAAKLFLGTPYVGGTLDKEKEERLTINAGELDCTTLVEVSLALALTVNENKKDFNSFCHNLQKIRYRGGVCQGYASRLHYFSWWADDGEKKGIMHEVKEQTFRGKHILDLKFMSNNPDKYMQLTSDSILTATIATHEQPFRQKETVFLPKSMLKNSKKSLPIRDGDIIALVTTIKGLDVTHMGIAVWQKSKLHMLHASSKEKKVILDKVSLHDYLAPRKSCPGIRVIRVK